MFTIYRTIEMPSILKMIVSINVIIIIIIIIFTLITFRKCDLYL